MLHLSLTLSLLVLMDFPMYIDTISMESSILYFKGLQVKISVLKIGFISTNSADPEEMPL